MFMMINESEIELLINKAVEATVNKLEERNLITNTTNLLGDSGLDGLEPIPCGTTKPRANAANTDYCGITKTAHQKTEQLLWYYPYLKRIVGERAGDVPDTVHNNTVHNTVHNTVQQSVQKTTQLVEYIDYCLDKIKSEPYSEILRMYYIEGKTQENIGVIINRDQRTVGRNLTRLVDKLAMYLFPDQFVTDLVGEFDVPIENAN